MLKSSRLCLVSFRNCFLNVAQDPRQENTMLKIQGVYDELKELYPSQRRSGLTLGSALPVAEEKKQHSSC